MDKPEKAIRQLSGPFGCMQNKRLLLFSRRFAVLGDAAATNTKAAATGELEGECFWGLAHGHSLDILLYTASSK